MKFPEKKANISSDSEYNNIFANGWNDCIDECKRLNAEVVSEDWKEAYANEFRKRYKGILNEDVIEISINWNIEFMSHYMPKKSETF